MQTMKFPLKRILPGQKYRNIKTQDIYQSFQIGKHSETEEKMVVYVSTQNRTLKNLIGLLLLQIASYLVEEKVWIRPVELFEEKFEEK